MAQINLKVNGKARKVDADSDIPLLYALRDNLGLNGPKFGCGVGQCGACTVLVNGQAALSCITPANSVQGKPVVTLEGLGSSTRLNKLQKAFVDTQAVQCGYCINGMIMSATALLATNKKPNEQQIQEALAGNLCRCGTHQRIVAAVKSAISA
jgi:nicotinate dehydrogenase subunit A